MILPGSYANGFAPRDGSPLYPELWRGCVGAWTPCLGPTGMTLRDWSGFGNHGTLTNGPSWGPLAGKQAITFDGTNDYIDFGVNPNVYGLSRLSCSYWVYKTSNTSAWVLARYNTSVAGGSVGDYFGCNSGTSTPNAVAAFGGATVNDYVEFTALSAITLNAWNHVAACVDLVTRSNTKIFVNGVPRTVTITTNGTPPTSFKAATSTVWTSGRIVGSNGSAIYTTFSVADTMMSARFLSDDDCKILSRRSGIAYELAPRRRSRAAVITSGFSALRPSILRGSR